MVYNVVVDDPKIQDNEKGSDDNKKEVVVLGMKEGILTLGMFDTIENLVIKED